MSEAPVQLRAVEEAADAIPEGLRGLRAPGPRNGAGRFVTDVLVDLGYVDRDRVQRAIEEARSSGTTP